LNQNVCKIIHLRTLDRKGKLAGRVQNRSYITNFPTLNPSPQGVHAPTLLGKVGKYAVIRPVLLLE